ncbi:hypothetical protein F2Q69_00016215 [Brassica cretica]|uniref:Uncharacterized protein n=1 Tax=Brassica cretica TaxID=69181 RepID=A0A8S9QPV0_BRACR|nr:hypothetical protein F2Q69_00016215 [Brassica cretica]
MAESSCWMCITLSLIKRGIEADLLYLGAGYPVSRSKLCQGERYDAAIKSAVEPEINQAVQTGHLGDTSDRGSVQGKYLNNQEVFFHESKFQRRLTHQGINEAWNYKKIFTEEDVMNFTNRRFPSPSSCEYQPLEVDFSPNMKRPSPESSMGFKCKVLAFQKAQNQKNWSRKNQNAINFLKPAKPTSI